MQDTQTLIDRLGQLASDYRAGDCPVAATDGSPSRLDALAANFLASLAALHATGWAGALGEASELPDERMPKDYLDRRARLLDGLEDALARLAMDYRSADTDAAMASAVRDYHAALNEMYRIGHWHGVPDVDSQLPSRDMPQAFHDRRRDRLARASSAPKPE